jgi:hypothetical protein
MRSLCRLQLEGGIRGGRCRSACARRTGLPPARRSPGGHGHGCGDGGVGGPRWRRSARCRRAQRTRRPSATGLSPAAASSGAALCGPTPLIARNVGVASAVSSSQRRARLRSVSWAASPGVFGRRRGNRAARAHQLLGVHAAQARAQLGRGGVDHGVELVGGLGAGLDGTAPGDPQQPDRRHRCGLGRGEASRLASHHRPGSTDRVGRVRRAVTATMLPVRARHLDPRHPFSREVPGQPGPPRPGALDTHHDEFTERPSPPQPPPPASRGRQEHLGAQPPDRPHRTPQRRGRPCGCRHRR